MKNLKSLSLTIPALDAAECKSLMGGDGYAGIDLPELIVTPDDDYDEDDDYDMDDFIDDDDNFNDDYDEDWDNPDHGDNDQNQGENDYSVPKELQSFFDKLPEKVQLFLQTYNVKIIFDPNYKNPQGGAGGYNPTTDTIIMGYTNDDSILFRETIHAIQNFLGIMDGNSHSAEEFQEKALGDLFNYYSALSDGYGFNSMLDFGDTGDNGNSNWMEFVASCFDNDNNFDRDLFIQHVMDYFNLFQDSHANNDGYNDPLENDYDWSWEYFFQLLGF